MSQFYRFLLLTLTLFLLVACGDEGEQTELPTLVPPATNPNNSASDDEAEPTLANPPEIATTVPADTPMPTAVPPTPTPMEELAATVNGRPILLADYEKELARYEQAQAESGITLDLNYFQTVLDTLIEKELIIQAATAQGIIITPEMVDAEMTRYYSESGDTGNFEAWLEVNQWTEEEFREVLMDEMITAQMAAVITREVPQAVEQVRARYIQVDDPDLAQTLWQQISNGDDFAFRAEEYSLDRTSAEQGGDLGFFPRGILFVPELEEAAFALEVGQLSDVITVTSADGVTTYYLVQVTERDAQRPLESDLLYIYLQQYFSDWLAEQWANADIQRLVNGDT